MLKNIRLHLDKDEEKQSALEQQLSAEIQTTYQRNVRAFTQIIPSLLPYIKNIKTQNIALFCNKWGETNIVDYGAGRTLYGRQPEQEITQQYDLLTQHCAYMDLRPPAVVEPAAKQTVTEIKQSAIYLHQQQLSPLPTDVEVLVVFGLGLGKHIQLLIERHNIKHLVIYEPELQYFQCSVLSTDWQAILFAAQRKGTAIYLQLEKDGRNLLADIQELGEHFTINHFYYYQHYNHPVFNSISRELVLKSWIELQKEGISYTLDQQMQNYLPHWTPPIDLSQYQDVEALHNQRFEKNIDAFKQYFPNIYQEFKDYQPKAWRPMSNAQGDINIIKIDSLNSWYGDDPQQECIANFDNFSDQPNKDGLVLGYTGTKLKHYIHYRFVAQTEQLLNEVEEEQGKLPDTLKALIMFGIGAGYQIEHLFADHKVEKLFLCEPNRDFFYASLFAIDWAGILGKVDASGGRIYINIGDDGSNLFRDLLTQFYSIGPYILTSTYFYQSYFNANLVQAIMQLREQLQVVISMGEYYDHARFGIAHTTEVIKRNYPLLTHHPAKQLSFEHKGVPVFMIGNGASLDTAIETIKEWQDRAIVISCGTSLQVLYKNGIVPDFHAELEQNRATFDWCCRVGDFDYLKQISLVSCNGIHPDTCDLFKDVYVAFKEGESSTLSALQILAETQYEKLKFAFPTVSNFVMNLFTSMQFNQLYLIGIDLGFVDNKNHHSKQSGYYDQQGKELYDYAAKNNTAIVIPGNFRSTVFTKHEFKVSKELIEQSLADSNAECFNCSDGAKIAGSIPLRLDNVLIVSTAEQKQQALNSIKGQAFVRVNQEQDYSQHFLAKFSPQRLEFELSKVIQRVSMEVNNIDDAEGLIESQKSMLFASYQDGRSLLFYLLYGTVNYANAVLSKLLSSSNEDKRLEQFNQAKQMWLDTLQIIYDDYIQVPEALDISSSFRLPREKIFVQYKLKQYQLVCAVPDIMSPFFQKQFHIWFPNDASLLVDEQQLCTDIAVFDSDKSDKLLSTLSQYVDACHSIGNPLQVLLTGQNDRFLQYIKKLNSSKFVISQVCALDNLQLSQDLRECLDGKRPYMVDDHFATYMVRHYLDVQNIAYFIPKLGFVGGESSDKSSYLKRLENNIGKVQQYIEYSSYIAVPRDGLDGRKLLVDQLGNRGRYIEGEIKLESLIGPTFQYKQINYIAKQLDRT